MRHSIDSHKTPARPCLPFSGLGFFLEPTRERAEALRLVPVRVLEMGVSCPNEPALVLPAGYELLVRLGREIRGR